MKAKRTYLTVPGQYFRVTIDGPSSTGKTQVMQKFVAMLEADGLMFSGERSEHSSIGYAESVVVTCPNEKQARDLYLARLGEHEIATLRGHLDALGYEL